MGHQQLEVVKRSRARLLFGRGRNLAGHRERPGVGLGLYLSRRIVRGHGSELTVQTRVGEGSVFGFELRVER